MFTHKRIDHFKITLSAQEGSEISDAEASRIAGLLAKEQNLKLNEVNDKRITAQFTRTELGTYSELYSNVPYTMYELPWKLERRFSAVHEENYIRGKTPAKSLILKFRYEDEIVALPNRG